MYGLAFFGFVVIALIFWFLAPRFAFAITLAVLAFKLGWVSDYDSPSYTIMFLLTLAAAIFGFVLDVLEHRDSKMFG